MMVRPIPVKCGPTVLPHVAYQALPVLAELTSQPPQTMFAVFTSTSKVNL
jgi:hypothetical protein